MLSLVSDSYILFWCPQHRNWSRPVITVWLHYYVDEFFWSVERQITSAVDSTNISNMQTYMAPDLTCILPVNMLDPIRKRFGYGQCASRIGPDSMCQIWLSASISVLFFQRRHGSYCAKPTWIWSGWPGQGLAKCIWSGSKLVCRNHLAWFLSGCNWPAKLLTFGLTSVHPQITLLILCKTSPDPIYFWLIVSGFGQTDQVWKQAGVQESSSPLLASASRLIRTRCELDPACLLS